MSSSLHLKGKIQTMNENYFSFLLLNRFPINVLHRFNPNVIASGDDEGAVKVSSHSPYKFTFRKKWTIQIWDLRQQSMVRDYSENEDFVSDMIFVENKNTLLVTRFSFLSFPFWERKNPLLVSSVDCNLSVETGVWPFMIFGKMNHWTERTCWKTNFFRFLWWRYLLCWYSLRMISRRLIDWFF